MVYNPTSWVVLKIKDHDTYYLKVLGEFEDGHWRINSGITDVKSVGDYFEFWAFSTSCYKCHKDDYGLKNISSDIYEKLKKQLGRNVELLPKDTNWMNI